MGCTWKAISHKGLWLFSFSVSVSNSQFDQRVSNSAYSWNDADRHSCGAICARTDAPGTLIARVVPFFSTRWATKSASHNAPTRGWTLGLCLAGHSFAMAFRCPRGAQVLPGGHVGLAPGIGKRMEWAWLFGAGRCAIFHRGLTCRPPTRSGPDQRPTTLFAFNLRSSRLRNRPQKAARN